MNDYYLKRKNCYRLLLMVLLGILVVTVLPVMVLSALDGSIPIVISQGHQLSITVNGIALVFCAWAMFQFQQYPHKHSIAYLMPTVMVVYGSIILALWLLRADYSIKLILLGIVCTLFFLIGLQRILNRYAALTLYFIPQGDISLLTDTKYLRFIALSKPELPAETFNGVVVDLHNRQLSAEWERFLAKCTLQKIPVYNALQLVEKMTGKTNVEHLVENEFGSLAPSAVLPIVKRVFDTAVILLIAPLLGPIMAAIAVWIRYDSRGGALFIQDRVGMGGQTFRMVKFRSMIIEHNGHHFTQENDGDRITRVGRIIRKYRLDELPQFWNVLIGEMSLIGPRPESLALAQWYEKEVPFFEYRHVVRPGISGWAQVKQGYAAEVEGMKEKLAYDFYYIKHFSFWLDLLIWYKTIRTVCSGFGAR